MMSHTHATKRGFTLLELLIVLAIIALIATLAAPHASNLLGGARNSTAKSQVLKLAGIIEIYQLNVGTYPTSQQGLRALVERPRGVAGWNGPYLSNFTALIDPWGKPYSYQSPAEAAQFVIGTLGADNRVGGDGDNEDVLSTALLAH